MRRRHCSIPISPCDQLSCRGNPPRQVLSVESLTKFLFGEGEAWMRCDASCRLNADPEPCLYHAHLQMFRPLGVRHDNTSGRVIHLLILTSVRSRISITKGSYSIVFKDNSSGSTVLVRAFCLMIMPRAKIRAYFLICFL